MLYNSEYIMCST